MSTLGDVYGLLLSQFLLIHCLTSTLWSWSTLIRCLHSSVIMYTPNTLILSPCDSLHMPTAGRLLVAVVNWCYPVHWSVHEPASGGSRLTSVMWLMDSPNSIRPCDHEVLRLIGCISYPDVEAESTSFTS